MITRSLWHYGGVLSIVCLVVCLPWLLYRVRQGWRNRSSIPAVAATTLAVVLYISALSSLEPVRTLLAQPVWAAQEAVRPILMAVCLQVFVISVSSPSPPGRLRRNIRVVVVVAVVVAIAAAAFNVAAVPCTADLYTCSSRPVQDPHVLMAYLVGSIYLFVVLAHSAWLGFRRFTRTPAGWGLGFLAAGCVVEAIAVVHAGIYRQFSPVTYTQSLWLEGLPVTAGIVLFVTGFMYPPAVARLRAWRFLRQVRPLWNMVNAQYPNLHPPQGLSRSSLPEKLSGQIACIQDAMTLTVQQRRTPLDGGCPPPRTTDQAAAVARWLAGHAEPELTCRWLATPESMSRQDWILAVAAALRAQVGVSPATGMPSTLPR